ncbi:helix-turn-helix transcriptional regulator [Paenibacillus chitinolyticus]|uniref:helix-turn-helix transcriptional regulator n=1 Tax=Paenibacillus chitinolyticus TaxID=79263 RepID=UPI0035DF5EE4
MKLERLVSMIYMLLNHEVMSASVLAEEYSVSQRTIYCDMDVICAAGFPVVSHQGVNGGYGIIEGYKLERSLLGAHDVISLITVLQSISTLFGEHEKAEETTRKLQTIRTEPLAENLTMDIGSRKEMLETLRRIREAASGREVIRFDYVNLKSERTLRTVEPFIKAARDNDKPLSDEVLQQLLVATVSDEKIRMGYDNFFKGYSAEELFRRLFSLLPWIKLITPLGQEQYPEDSKKKVQTPDYEITYEAGSKDNLTKVLVEVKLVDGNKQTFDLLKHTYDVLKNYEIYSPYPFVFAIFCVIN